MKFLLITCVTVVSAIVPLFQQFDVLPLFQQFDRQMKNPVQFGSNWKKFRDTQNPNAGDSKTENDITQKRFSNTLPKQSSKIQRKVGKISYVEKLIMLIDKLMLNDGLY